jgi:peptidoglycan LD-endopeptidase LytH
MASFITKTVKIRTHDNYGNGTYGASRDGGKRQHKGLDVISKANEPIYAPISGSVSVTRAYGIDSDPVKEAKKKELKCVKIFNKEKHILVKMMYVKAVKSSGLVNEGDLIGYAQDLDKLYPSITNHVHVEYLVNGKKVHPQELWQICFDTK